MERMMDVGYGTHKLHNRIYRVLEKMKRKWVRYERECSNTIWRMDWTFVEGKGTMIDW